MFCRFLYLCVLLSGLLWLPACTPAPPPAPSYLTTIPDPKTLGEAYVSNPDGLLSAATVAGLNTTLRVLDQTGRAHIDVVVVNSIGEEVPKTAATALFNRWKIGDRKLSNGLLLLLVQDQRRVEFETGYGLEADLPDILCFRIQQRYMVPYLRAGQLDEAVRKGVAATIQQLTTGAMALPAPDSTTLNALEPLDASPLPDQAPQETKNVLSIIGTVAGGILALALYGSLWRFTSSDKRYLGALLLPPAVVVAAFQTGGHLNFWLVLGVFYLLPLLCAHAYLARVQLRRRRRYAGQGRHAEYVYLQQAHHGLGFTAKVFPVGLLPYWRWHQQHFRQLREAPYPCPTCATPLRKLRESADNAYLEPGQAVEEKIKSVDYDVWLCKQCQYQLVLDYRNLDSEATTCAQCQRLTFEQRRLQVMQPATTSAEGWGWNHFECAHCSHATQERYTIPQKSDSAGSSSSGSSSSSSSSSGSSSSSSGGSSGGGGAGSSW